MQKTHTHLTSRTALALAALAVSPLAHAGDGYYGGGGGLAGQELIRRQQAVNSADQLLIEGREAYAKGEYEEAVDKYREALNILPFGTATADRRQIITKHLEDGSVALSQTYRRQGKYDEARTLLTDVVEADPGNVQATRNLEYLDDPIRTNPALTYEHTQNIDKVRRLLYTGEGYYNNGQYDKAIGEFHAVLRIDPYNKAARRWMERVNAIKSDYYRAAYDETRSRLLSQVDAAWEMSVPPVGEVGNRGIYGNQKEDGSIYITSKLQQIRIPIIDFEDVTVEEAIDFLRQRSRELDTTTTVESEKGINFIVRRSRVETAGGGADAGLDDAVGGLGGLGGGPANPGEKRIKSLKLKNVPLATALQYICDQASLRYKVDEFAVTLLPLTAGEEDEVLTRRWQVPPDFMSFMDTGSGGDAGGAGGGDPFAGGGGDDTASIVARGTVQDLLSARGVKFNDSSSASYLPGTSTLLVVNTPSQLELVEAIVDASVSNTPKQIKILTKFVEVAQENTDELGFDWIISPFNFSSQFIPGGGTTGSGIPRNGTDFVDLGGAVPGIPTDGGAVNNIVTAGNRSGDSALSRNSIDAILNNPSRTAQTANVAPGILSFTGLFSGGQVQMIMRGLAQKKGTDIMTAPSVMARPGQKATIEIIREFIYPTEYEPPELPNTVGTTSGLGGEGVSGGGSFPVTPATPTAFETRNTGVTLEIEPNVGANDSLIELRFAPEIVEFEGFINYGSPITAPAVNPITGASVPLTITENRIEMPVFATRRVTTGITIYDGYTVAVGGLMREDVQNVEDKVPVLGDLPFIGRLFQNKAENHIKSNLIIFVTAEIIDATGRRLNPSSGLDTASSAPSTPTIGGGDTMLPPL